MGIFHLLSFNEEEAPSQSLCCLVGMVLRVCVPRLPSSELGGVLGRRRSTCAALSRLEIAVARDVWSSSATRSVAQEYLSASASKLRLMRPAVKL